MHLHLCNFLIEKKKKNWNCVKTPKVQELYCLFCIEFCSLNHSFTMVLYTGYRHTDTEHSSGLPPGASWWLPAWSLTLEGNDMLCLCSHCFAQSTRTLMGPSSISPSQKFSSLKLLTIRTCNCHQTWVFMEFLVTEKPILWYWRLPKTGIFFL